MYIIITEQDDSPYKDRTGEQYHFPNAKYLARMSAGDTVIYYKGKIDPKRKELINHRLSIGAHYFAIGKIEKIIEDSENDKMSIAIIKDFLPFPKAVPFKINGEYLEDVIHSNHFMGGNSVRRTTEKTYNKIIKIAGINLDENDKSEFNDLLQGESGSFKSYSEGKKKQVFTTIYERRPELREQAVSIHGYSCVACGFNFKNFYGEWGEGFIHIHHIKPISEKGGENLQVDPKTDLAPLCPNCHSMVHRKKSETLSIEKLIEIIRSNGK
jgi:5-methylcytosine-specific restriction protein A